MYIKVNVQPGSKKERVTQMGECEYEMCVKEPAQQNMANTRVRAILAELYHTQTKAVRMVSGHRSRSKMFTIEF